MWTVYIQWPTVETRICLSKGTIFYDLERPRTPISRSRHYLTLNNSEMVRDTVIVSSNRLIHALLKGVISNDLQ